MSAPKRFSRLRDFQNTLGVNKVFGIPQSIHQINSRLLKLGFAALPLRNMQLSAQLAKAGLVNDNLVQWYQAAHGVTQSANAVSQWLNLAPSRITLNKSLQQITAANMPTLLAHAGGTANNYGYVNGVSGNYFSTPDSTAVSVTGDIECIVKVSLANWATGTQQCLIGKRVGAGTFSYQFSIATDGKIRVDTSIDGTTGSAASSAVTGFINGATMWVRFTRVASSGLVSFYYASDQVNVPSSWTSFGTANNTSGNIFDSSVALEIGSFNTGTTQNINGTMGRVQIYNGIVANGGTLAFDFNPATYVSGTTFVDSSVNAATITINGGAVINTASSIYFDGVNDYLRTGAFTLNQPTTAYAMLKQITWTVNDKLWDGNASDSLDLFQTSVSPAIRMFAGSSGPITSALPLETQGIVTTIYNGANSIMRVNRAAAATGDVGTANASGFTLGARGDGTQAGNVTVSEVLIFNVAHSTAQQDIVIGYLSDKYSLGL